MNKLIVENISNANEKFVKTFDKEIEELDEKIINIINSKGLKIILADKLSDVLQKGKNDVEKYQDYHPADRDINARGLCSDIINAVCVFSNVVSMQNLGANQINRIKQGVKAGMMITISLSLAIIALITMFSKYMILWFMSEINQEVVTLAQQYLYIIMFFYIFFGFLMVFRNTMQGTGNVIGPLLSGLCELFARIFCAMVLGSYFGYVGVCVATPAAWVVGTIILYILFKISLKKQTCNTQN